MGRFINILYAIVCMFLYIYFIVYSRDGDMAGISEDAQLIGLSLIIAGCLAYGGND